MSDLQLGLIVIGVAVVVGIFAFNRWQERQLHRRVEHGEERAGRAERDPESARREWLEPSLAAAPEPSSGAADQRAPLEAPGPEAVDSVRPALRLPGDAQSSSIDYVCTLHATMPIPAESIQELVRAIHSVGRRISVRGWSAAPGEWIALPAPEGREVCEIMVAAQLADRAGAINRAQLSTLRDLLQGLANQLGAHCHCPEIESAAQAAIALDRFCAQVDISIGCNLIPKTGSGLAGTKMRGLLESCGYMLEADGKFWLFADDGRPLLSAADPTGKPLSGERLRTEALSGLTLSMDVPHVPAGARAFERLFETARHLAHGLEAGLVDDNRAPLTEPGLKVIRQQLDAVQAAMQARGIAPGSELAVRLFS